MKKDKTEKHSRFTGLRRYTGLVLFILLFITVISALLSINYYMVNKNDRINHQLVTINNMDNALKDLRAELYNLRISWGEDPNAPNVRSSMKRLLVASTQFDQNFQALRQGGQNSNNNVVRPLSRAFLPLVDDLNNRWSVLKPAVNNHATSIVRADSTTLDIAINYTQTHASTISEDIQKIQAELEQKRNKSAKQLKLLQWIGIVLAIIFFLLFLLLFIKRLLAADRLANEARRETKDIMATVKEGLFLVDHDLHIGQQYSNELEKIIGQKDIGGKPLQTVLSNLVQEKDAQTTAEFIEQLFNKKVKPQLINDLNPLHQIKVEVDDLNGYHVDRYLDFHFYRVYHDKEIARVLASVSDITAEVELRERLEREREQNDQQVEMLSTILKTDPTMMRSFVNTVRHCMGKINATLRNQDASPAALQNKLRDIYREAHSMKGEASALKLQSFVNIATSFEERIKQLQTMPNITGNDFLSLTVILDELHSIFNTVAALAERIGVSGFGENQKPATSTAVASTDSPLVNYFKNYAEGIAERNNKQVQLNIQDSGFSSLPEATQMSLKEICIQLLRNAIVHGVGTPDERTQSGKTASGRVAMLFKKSSDGVGELIVEDDGKGIDFEKIRQKAVQKGLYSFADAQKLTKGQLLNLIFTSGFSTAEEANVDAGRGVGLDLIQERVKELKGKMKIASVFGQYTRFTITLPLR